MRITVIVAAYDKPWHLERVLNGYDVQTDDNFEIIVAEDGASSAVKEVVDGFASKSRKPIIHLTQEDTGFRKTVILNKAIKASSGEYLIFTDDDCIPRADIVEVHRAYAKQGRYIVGAYNRLPERTSDAVEVADVRSQKIFRFGWLVRNGYYPTRGFVRILAPRWLSTLMDKRGKLSHGRFPGGHSSCFKADAEKIGGFDERMGYGLEDREFGTRLCNSGIMGKRVKNSTYMLHLHHGRPYQNLKDFEDNQVILSKTVESGRIIAGHIDEE